MRFVLTGLVALALSLSSVAAHADTFTYSFVSTLYSLSFQQPSILTADTIVNASDFLTTTPGIEFVEINPRQSFCGRPPTYVRDASSCVFVSTRTLGVGYFFPQQFTAPGTYSLSNAQLTITQQRSDASPVPEPGTLLLLTTGIAGPLAWWCRKSVLV